MTRCILVKANIAIKCRLMSFTFLILSRKNLIPITCSHIHRLLFLFIIHFIFFLHYICIFITIFFLLSISYGIEIISLFNNKKPNSSSLELISRNRIPRLPNSKTLKIIYLSSLIIKLVPTLKNVIRSVISRSI